VIELLRTKLPRASNTSWQFKHRCLFYPVQIYLKPIHTADATQLSSWVASAVLLGFILLINSM